MERWYGLHEDEVVVTCYMDFHLVVHYFGWVVDVVEKSTHTITYHHQCVACKIVGLWL